MPTPHTSSYYAHSAEINTEYDSLTEDIDVDVGIVGAGFSGIAAALSLAERGYRVAVVEQNRVGWGASGRNGGQMIAGISGEDRLLKQQGEENQEMLLRLGYLGNELIASRVEKYGLQIDLKYGYMDLALKPRHMRDFESHLETLQRYQLDDKAELVSRKNLSSCIGSEIYLGGLKDNRQGHLHPLKLCQAEAQAAASLGVQIYENTTVTAVDQNNRPTIRTRNATVRADSVLITGNGYFNLPIPQLTGRVFPAGSFIIATEPLSQSEANNIIPQDMAFCDARAVLDYFRLSADKRLLFGGQCNYSGRVPKDIIGSMLPRMLKVFPQLRGKMIDFAWGGNIGIVPNRVPLIGRLSNSNVYYAMGYSGHGVNMTHIAGDIIADAIGGSMQRLDLFQAVKHRPIPFGQTFGNQMMALGMLYYRVRDLL